MSRAISRSRSRRSTGRVSAWRASSGPSSTSAWTGDGRASEGGRRGRLAPEAFREIRVRPSPNEPNVRPHDWHAADLPARHRAVADRELGSLSEVKAQGWPWTMMVDDERMEEGRGARWRYWTRALGGGLYDLVAVRGLRQFRDAITRSSGGAAVSVGDDQPSIFDGHGGLPSHRGTPGGGAPRPARFSRGLT